MKSFSFLFRVVKDSFRKFFEIRGLLLSSGLAFDLLLSAIPLLLLVMSILGYVLGESTAAGELVHRLIRQFIPSVEGTLVEGMIATIENRHVLGISGFVLFLVTGSGVLSTIRTALNQVFDTEKPRGILHGKLIDFLLLLALPLLILAAIAANTLMLVGRRAAAGLPFLDFLVHPGWVAANYLFDVLFSFLIFYSLYRFCPGRTLRSSAVFLAGGMATVLFEASKIFFSWYISSVSTFTVIYGALNGFIIFILWFYYASVIFIYSGTAAWAFDRAGDDMDRG
jgi:membrane protein